MTLFNKKIKNLEYRGYDSCGVAVIQNGKIDLRKNIVGIDDVNLKEGVVSSEKKNLVIKIFTELMEYEFAQGEKFKGGSYKKVLPALKKLSSDYELSAENLKKINGLGKGLLEKIDQICPKGTQLKVEPNLCLLQ